jgi:hypothetical protein
MIHPSKMPLVDDNPFAVDSLELEDSGSTTVSVSNGREPSRRSMTARRVSRFVSFVLGLALGTGIAVLLGTLSAWFSS